MHIRTHLAVLAGVTIAATALIPAAATLPEKDKVTICHATGNPGHWVKQNVAVESILRNNGHSTHQGGRDIIPPFNPSGDWDYFPGLNWDDAGKAVWKNGCATPEPVPSPTPSESVTPTPEPTPEPTPTVTASPTIEPTPSETPDPTPEPSETPTPMPTVTPTTEPTPMPTVTVTASPAPQPTETVTVPAPTVTATATVPGSTTTVTTSPEPQPTATATQTVTTPATTPADPCALGDPYESRMCETSASPSVLPVESSSASSTQTALPAEAPAEQVRPGLPRAGA